MVVEVQNVPDLPFFAKTDVQTAYLGSTKLVYIRVDDTDTTADGIAIWAISTNGTILHNHYITVEGLGNVRTLTLTPPADGLEGDVTIEVYADDGRAFAQVVDPNAEEDEEVAMYGVVSFLLQLRAPPTIDPAQCWATGTGLEVATAGVEASFTVYTVDTEGDIQGAGANITIQQHGPSTLEFVTTIIDDGIMLFTYTPTVRGDYLVMIRQSGSKIRHGAFNLYVDHAEMSPAACFFTSSNSTAAGAVMNITIQVRAPHSTDTHGLCSSKMALITSDCGTMRYLSIKWP